MTHKMYRDDSDGDYEVIELELDEDLVAYLENRALTEQKNS